MRFCRRIFILFLLSVGLLPVLVQGMEWKKLIRGSCVLHCHDSDMEHGRMVLSMAEERIPKIARDLKLSSVETVNIVIAPTDREFARITGGQIPEWGTGAADPSRSVIFLKSPRFARPEVDLKQVVIHELSHVILAMAVDQKPVDRWFDEGFAQWQSEEHRIGTAILLARSLLTGNVLWLDEIDEVLSFRRDKAALAYFEARSAIDFLIQEHGPQVLGDIVNQLRMEKGMDEALLATIDLGFQDFQTDWYHAMKRKYRWYILLDFRSALSLILVILFVTAFIATRLRIRKKKRLWAEEDGYGIETVEEHSA